MPLADSKDAGDACLKRLNFKLDNVPHVVLACIVLHNKCGDDYLKEWTDFSLHNSVGTSAPSTTGSVEEVTSQ